MIRSIGAQCGLLMFGVAIAAGLIAGNSATTILWRAVAAMLVASFVGQVAAWSAGFVLRDLADKTKRHIETEFRAAQKAAAEAEKAVAEIEIAEAA